MNLLGTSTSPRFEDAFPCCNAWIVYFCVCVISVFENIDFEFNFILLILICIFAFTGCHGEMCEVLIYFTSVGA